MATPGPTPAPAEIRQDEILTGEAVALDVQPVGFFLRALGLLIDMLTGIALLALFLLAASWVTGVGLDLSALSPALTVASLAVVTVVLPTAVETITRGRSLGKLAVGSRIVRTDGGAAGFRHAFIRALTGVLEVWFTLGAVAGIVGAFTPRAQRLGDLLAGTYAERTRVPQLPSPAGGVPEALADWARIADVTRLPYRVARRAAQFVRTATGLDPAARARTAAAIAADVAPHVSPLPAVDPETLVRAVVAVRRDREYAALVGEQARMARLTAGTRSAPRGFPER
ncbi:MULTISPECIES: RDD family protein [Microbacterium]|uniref:Uncharacterized membrane protein YckC, RDD family n=1 Tax=Microbacterium saccharophilum TaxID=1213358 RepID=A0A7Z7D2U1_9MICO|nr:MULTISPECIES: RDD family protein [Microbacterium]SFI63955.1 Uncharacterized membrane protein YckC, RDD family [Microbacterium saccharophilum]